MDDKRAGPASGTSGDRPEEDRALVDEARLALPGLVRESGLFDFDYDPSEIARMGEIFEHLPDSTVIDLAKRLGLLITEKKPDIAAFSQEFGISSAEQKLLESLIDGHTVVVHAEQAGISVNTARTHMRRLLEKTGSSGQLDLIRMVHHKS